MLYVYFFLTLNSVFFSFYQLFYSVLFFSSSFFLFFFFLLFSFNTRELGKFVGGQIINSLSTKKPYKERTLVPPLCGYRTRLIPPVSVHSLPTFILPKTVSCDFIGSKTLLYSSLPYNKLAVECQALLTGQPGGNKLSVLKVSIFSILYLLSLSRMYIHTHT